MIDTDISTPHDAPWRAAYNKAGIAPELNPPTHASLAALVHEACNRYAQSAPKQAAFTCVVPNGMNGSLRFAEVDALSDAFAGYLRGVLGLQAGDRVAVQLPNCLAYPVVAFGVFKAGCVLVNTNPLYTEKEMAHQLKDAGAQALVIIDMFADKLPAVLQATGLKHVVLADVTAFFPAVPRAVVRSVQKVWSRVLPPITVPHVRLAPALKRGAATLSQTPARRYWEGVGPGDLAALQYTGGTTGVSKGAMLTHSNLLHNVNQMLAMGATHMSQGQECVLTALPLYHIFAFTANLLGFLVIGARNVLVPSPRPVQNLQRAIENNPITWMTGVAGTSALMLKGGRNVVSKDAAAATVTAAVSVADSGIDDDPTGAARSDDAASSMLEKGKRNKNGTNNIGIQAFDAILQLGLGYRLIAQLLSHDMWGRSSMPHSPSL